MGCDEFWDVSDAFEPSSPVRAEQQQQQQEDEIEEEFHPGEQGDDDDGAEDAVTAGAGNGANIFTLDGSLSASASASMDASINGGGSALEDSTTWEARQMLEALSSQHSQHTLAQQTPPPPVKARRSPYSGPFHFGIESVSQPQPQQLQSVNVTPQQPQRQHQQQQQHRPSSAKQHPMFADDGDDGGLDALSLEESSESAQFPAAATQMQSHARPPKTGHGRRRDDSQQQPDDHDPPTSSFATSSAVAPAAAGRAERKKYPSEGLHLSPAPAVSAALSSQPLGHGLNPHAPFPSSKQPLASTMLPPTQIVNRLSRPPLGAIVPPASASTAVPPATTTLSRESSAEEEQQPQQQQQMPGRPGGGRSFNSRERKSPQLVAQQPPLHSQSHSQSQSRASSSFDQSSDGSDMLDSSANSFSLVDPHNHPAYGSAAGGSYAGLSGAAGGGGGSDSDEDSLESLQHSHGSSSSVLSAGAAAAALAQAMAAPAAPSSAPAPLPLSIPIPAFAKPPLGSRNMLAPAATATAPAPAAPTGLGRPKTAKGGASTLPFDLALSSASNSASHFPGGKAVLQPKTNFGAQAAATALLPPRNMLLSAGRAEHSQPLEAFGSHQQLLQQRDAASAVPSAADGLGAMERPKSGRQRGGGTPDVTSTPFAGVTGSPPLGPRLSRRGRRAQEEEEESEEEEEESEHDASQHSGGGGEPQILTLNTPPDSAQSTPFRSPTLDHNASTSGSVSASGSGSHASSPAADFVGGGSAGSASREGSRGTRATGVFSAHFEQLDLEDLSSAPSYAMQAQQHQQQQQQQQPNRSPSFATKMLSGAQRSAAAASSASASSSAAAASVPLRRRSFGTPPHHPQSTPESPDLMPAAAPASSSSSSFEQEQQSTQEHDHEHAYDPHAAGSFASSTPPSGSAASSPPQALTHIVITPPSPEMATRLALPASASASVPRPCGAAPAAGLSSASSPSKSSGGGSGWVSQHIQPTRLALKFSPASIALFYDLFDSPPQPPPQQQPQQQQRTLIDRRVHLMPLGALDPQPMRPNGRHTGRDRSHPPSSSAWDWSVAPVDEIVSRLYTAHPHYLGSIDAPIVSAQQLAALVAKIKSQHQSQSQQRR